MHFADRLSDRWPSVMTNSWKRSSSFLLLSISPFSIIAYPALGVVGGLQPIPAVLAGWVGYALDKSPVQHGETHINTYGQFRFAN